MRPVRSIYLLQWAGAACLMLGMSALYAGSFLFNYGPNGTKIEGGANNTGGGITSGNDGSRFFQDKISVDGKDYFHVVVGDPALGFALEYYTTRYSSFGSFGKFGLRPASPDSGGNERSMIGNLVFSESGIKKLPGRQFGNAKDPFGRVNYRVNADPVTNNIISITAEGVPIDQRYRVSGNGTMNPNRMTMKMKLSDAGLDIEVDKPLLERKAKITQLLNDGPLVMKYVADMRASSFSDGEKTVDIVNILRMENPDMFVPGSGDFDQSLMAQKSKETAGHYTYTPGGGWNTGNGWDVDGSRFTPGSYTYSDGESFDPLTVHWERYFSYEQNAEYCSTGYRTSSVCPQ